MTRTQIEKAKDFTLSALTLSEKKLAEGLLSNEQYRKVSRAVWLREPVLSLGAAIEKARNGAALNDFKAKFINIYCDTLIIEDALEISPEQENGREVMFSIEIFARDLIFDRPEAKSMSVRFARDSEILFWTSKLPEDFQLSFQSSLGNKIIRPTIDEGSFGIQISCETSGPKQTPLPCPDTAFENINYMDLISEDGRLLDKEYRNDDLPRLLQFQLLVAQAHRSLAPKLALDLLEFVISATATPKGAYLSYQASVLRNNLMIDAEVMSVPSVNIYASKQVLKSRLVAAMAFEEAFRDYTNESTGSEFRAETALNMLAKSHDAMETYDFLRSIRVKEYDNAVNANTKAEKTMEHTQLQLQSLGADFQLGIENWKQAQLKSAAKEIFAGIISVGTAIGATIITGGAAAPLAISAAANVASNAGKVAQLVAKLKTILDRLKKVYEKVKPVIEKLKKLVETTQAVIKALQDIDKATKGSLTVQTPVAGNDVFNATADWRRFDIIIREMQESLTEYKDIGGKDEYFRALKTLVVDGETYILTQANLVQKGDELATVILQQKMQRRDDSRLTATASHIAEDVAVKDILTRAMFDRILAIRAMVYLDFFTYKEAYRYHTLSDDAVVTLSPVKPVVDYLEDAAKLQGAIASFGSKVLVQQRTFRVDSLCGFDSAQSLATALTAGESVSVNISTQDAMWDRFGRIRLSCARCWLEGVQLSTSADTSKTELPLRIELRTEDRFYDHMFAAPSQGLEESSAVKSFVGDPRTLLFEYQPDTRAILCDGLFGQERDYTKHTPICRWSLRLANCSTGILNASDLFFSNFRGIKLEFVCDFTLKTPM